MEKEPIEAVDDVLSHYGKLGMKWGVRTRVAAKTRPGQPQPVMIGEKPGHRLVTAGGRGHPATDEAKRAAGLGQKARKSGVQSLSNKELKELNERMNLEQNYSKLTSADAKAKKSKGAKFTEAVLNTGKKEFGKLATDSITKMGKDAIMLKSGKGLPLSTAWGK